MNVAQRKVAWGLTGLAALVAVVAFAASADAVLVSSAGPLTRIFLDPQTNCQVHDTYSVAGPMGHGEYYSGTTGACATYLAVGSTLYGPATCGACGSASPRTSWTSVSQTPVTGAGTTSSPFEVETIVRAGNTGIELTQVDSYIVGEPAYYTYMTVTNTGSAAQTVKLWRGGDCYLNNSDPSYGFIDPANFEVACTRQQGVQTPSYQILWRTPAGSGINAPNPTFQQAGYWQVWQTIGNQNPFPNTCVCTWQDDGLGIGWASTVLAPGAFYTVCIENIFSNAPMVGCVPPIPPTPPIAEFQWVQPDPCYPTIQFIDLSYPFIGSGDSIVSYSWNFGDGGTSTVPNPTHAYASPGPWLATLTVTDDDGETSTTFSLSVTLCVPPVPQFTYSLVSPCDTHSPFMQFVDTSYDPDVDGSVTGIHWSFGDGGYSYESNPYYTWGDEAGTHAVTLTAQDNFGTLASVTVQVVFPGFQHCPMAVGDSQQPDAGAGPPEDGVVTDVADDDVDEDGVAADLDNCSSIANPTQADADGDRFGDACDSDADGDNRANDADNCWLDANTEQANLDGDGFGDACDDDVDGDGVADQFDSCKDVRNSVSVDADGDGVSDACDLDVIAGDAVEPLAGSAPLEREATEGSAPVSDVKQRPLALYVGSAAVAALLVAGTLVVALRRKA